MSIGVIEGAWLRKGVEGGVSMVVVDSAIALYGSVAENNLANMGTGAVARHSQQLESGEGRGCCVVVRSAYATGCDLLSSGQQIYQCRPI